MLILKKIFLVLLAAVISLTLASSPAFAYEGTMKVFVCDETSEDLSTVNIQHKWNKFDNHFDEALNKNQCSSFPINVGSGGHDIWNIHVGYPNGGATKIDYQCDVREEDVDSDKPIYLNLLTREKGFSIEMPSSSSCTDVGF